MNKNIISQGGLNVDKWIIFTVLFILTILEIATGMYEYKIVHNPFLFSFSLVRILSLWIGVYAVGYNKSTMIKWAQKILYAGLALSAVSFLYVQFLHLTSNLKNEEGVELYTILSIFEMLGVLIIARWYINSEKTESWMNYRGAAKNQEYISLDQFQYGNMVKNKNSKGGFGEEIFQHTAEVKNGKIMIKVKPISEIIKEDIEWNIKDELVSSKDKIDQYDRNSGDSIFLNLQEAV